MGLVGRQIGNGQAGKGSVGAQVGDGQADVELVGGQLEMDRQMWG